MVQLKISSLNAQDNLCLIRRFPFSIGRSPASDLCLTTAGMWDQHAEIRMKRPDGFELSALGDAIVTVNDQPVRQIILRNGDQVGLGAVKMQFALSPTKPRKMAWREWGCWLALTALCLGQVALIYLLPG